VKRFFAITLGILTAIGGFVDIGDLVANALVGSRYGFALAWVIPVGVLGICLFAEMSGRVAAASGRGVFDLIRERLGPRWGLANLAASFLVTALTLTAEIGGVALALELATSVARFHLIILLTLIAGVMVILTTVDPIKVTEYSIVFSAVALPLTYLPILIVANDPGYMGERVNGRFANVLGTAYLALILVVSAAAIPLMIATKAGQ